MTGNVSLIEKLDEIIELTDPEEAKTHSVRISDDIKVWELARSIKYEAQHMGEVQSQATNQEQMAAKRGDSAASSTHTLIQTLHDTLHGTDADIAFGHLRHIISEYEKLKAVSSEISLPSDNDLYEIIESAASQTCDVQRVLEAIRPYLRREYGIKIDSKIKRAKDIIHWATNHENKKAHVGCTSALKDLIEEIEIGSRK